MIVLISGILGISPEIYEAAEIDGATSWDKFRYVTLPNLRTILIYTLVTSLIGGLQMFDIPQLLIISYIKEKVSEYNKNYYCVIHIDRAYVK